MIILTPNRRLTAFSLQQYNVAQLAAKQQSWITPEIYPIEKWLADIWGVCLDSNVANYRPLLTSKQQQLLFEQIIQRDSVNNELLRVAATAQNAVQAWTFLKQWQVDLSRVAEFAPYSTDTAAFYRWLQAYLLWLEENQYYDFHLMVDRLINIIPEIVAILPKKICLRGFNELTPQYANLIAKLKDVGIALVTDQLTMPGAQVVRSGFEDFQHELSAAATWATGLLAANAQQTVGIVIPNLEQQRDSVHGFLGPVFPPGWVNISAPLPLAKYGLIFSALQILKLAVSVINYNDFSVLLRSPFIVNNFAERDVRAQLDRMLREKVAAKVPWEQILAVIADASPTITGCITDFMQLLANLQGKQTAEYWVEQLQALLQAWGWPGDSLMHQVNTQEMDLLSCWRALLEEYCKLNIVLPKQTFAQCQQFIRRLANEIPFLPAETGLTKVHVLGLLEAEGLVFDHLWVCGMSREEWPPAANPNPFIPLELQRQFDLPHSSPQRELAMAKKYTANLQQGGKQNVVFSYPIFVDDYSMQPSNLIMHLAEVNLVETNLIVPAKTAVDQCHSQLETWQDATAPSLTTSYLSGGAKILALQAQCPFKANAELRLQAKPLAEPPMILTPAMRGSLVHAVLESFWRKCVSHAQLVAYTAEELAYTLSKIIEDTLDIWQRNLPFILTNNYIQLEAHRLYKLLARWLEYEGERNPFVVYQLEQKTLINIGALQLNMQIDRIDQVEDSYVIIDYKTGVTQVYYWFTDPIYEPQLPIYAVSVPQNIVAVAFASLRAQELKFIGVATEDGILPNVKANPDWASLQQEWQQKLVKCAQDFVDGIATVTPFSTQVCNFCELQPLCRIYEQQL